MSNIIPELVKDLTDGGVADPQLAFLIPSARGGESPPLKIRLHQATTNDNDQGANETNTGFVMWPSAVILSHYLSQNPHICRGDDTLDGDVMELGAGCGLAGLTAAALLQNESDNDDKVIFTDYNPAVLENLKRNVVLNDFDVVHEVLGCDWFDQKSNDDKDKAIENTWVDMEGVTHGQYRLILGADLLVCSNDADLVATTIDASLMEGGEKVECPVLITLLSALTIGLGVAIIVGASADRRFGVSGFPDACHALGLTVTVDENILEANESAREEAGTQKQFMDGLELGGYNQRASTHGQDFTMFTINKPITSS